jgi:hypothetical protein
LAGARPHLDGGMADLIAIVVLLIIVLVPSVQYLGRYVYTYKIGETGLEIALFRLVSLKRICFDNIVEIRRTSFRETLPFSNPGMRMMLTFENRLWGELVLVRQKPGFFKIILISPDDADNFIQEVQRRISGSKDK